MDEKQESEKQIDDLLPYLQGLESVRGYSDSEQLSLGSG